MSSLFTPPHRHETQRWRHKRIGLFGGTFNPPHEGHLHVAQTALHALELDFIWWLVTPQNPLKTDKPSDTRQRIALCRNLARHPKMLVTALEEDLGTRTSYDSVRALKNNFPTTQFVWISGMDNALSLHRWNNWRDLLAEIPFFYLTRPPASALIQGCPLKLYTPQKQKLVQHAGKYPLEAGTTYWMMNRKMIDQSSTQIRKKAEKQRP